ncbi:MAG: hypothetical protein LH624_07715, partial [Cryobacterium sp.]|nr:hypothetical protein [Cryobacterium sp.]
MIHVPGASCVTRESEKAMRRQASSAGKHLEDRLDPVVVRALEKFAQPEKRWSSEVQLALARTIGGFEAAQGVRHVIEASESPVGPERMTSIAQTDTFWRNLADEFGLLTSQQVAEHLPGTTNRSYASRQRRAGKLIAVTRANKVLYPGFQFHDGMVRPVIKQLTGVAQQHDVTERDMIFWLCTPTTYF